MSKKLSSKFFNLEVHPSNLLKRLNEDRQKERPKYCDIAIISGEKKFPLHRCVLGLTTGSYNKIFHDEKKGKYLNEAKIKDVQQNILEIVFDFLYTGNIRITNESLDEIRSAAIKMNIDQLLQYCNEFSTNHSPTSKGLMSSDKTAHHLRRHHTNKKSHKSLENMDIDDLKNFTEDKSLKDQFQLMIDWMKYDVNKRERHIGDLMEWMGLKEELEQYLYHNTNSDNVAYGNGKQPTSNIKNEHGFNDITSTVEAKFKLLMKFFEDQTIRDYFNSLHSNPGFLALKKKEVWKYDLITQNLIGFPNLHFDHYQGSMVKVGKEIMVISGWRTSVVEALNLMDELPFWKRIADAGCDIKLAGAATSKNCIWCVGGTPYKNSGVRYDCARQKWNDIQILQHDRSDGPALVCVEEKKSTLFYVVGGDDADSKTSEKFDSRGGKRQLLPNMKKHRSKLSAVVLQGEIYAIGGVDEHNKNLSSVEKYCPNHNHWLNVDNMKVSRHCHGACVIDNKIYVAGGGSDLIEVFDPDQNMWTTLTQRFEELRDVECLVAI